MFSLVLQEETFYLRNRIVLILTIIVPLILPLIRIRSISESPVGVIIIHPVISAGEAFSRKVTAIDYNGLLVAIWLGIACLIMIRTVFGLLKTAAIIRKGTPGGTSFPKMIISDVDYPPFSFWPYVVIPRKILDSGDAQDIIAHENAHIRQGHTFDLIICELYTSLFWFNPAAWKIRKSIRLNHEFLADHALTRFSADIKTYQYKLLTIPMEYSGIQFAHNFNNLIKNRIVMINKKQTSASASWKILVIIPVVALIFAAFSCKDEPVSVKDNANGPRILTDIKIDKPDEPVFVHVDELPEFPGGQKAMLKFISETVKYPESAIAKNVEGTVVVRMVIDKNGKVKDGKVLKSVPGLDEEALRVIKSMPEWKPGKQGGRAVSVSFVLPLVFKLGKDKK